MRMHLRHHKPHNPRPLQNQPEKNTHVKKNQSYGPYQYYWYALLEHLMPLKTTANFLAKV